MKLIAITSESAFIEEIRKISAIIDSGFDYIHVRKPQFSIEEMRSYLSKIPESILTHITIGSHHNLLDEFNVGGVHLKSDMSISDINMQQKIRISKSCHYIAEIKDCYSDYDYVFLSPIFNSISKDGYNSHFSIDTLQSASQQGVLKNVIALGGMNAENMKEIKDLSFYGYAFLGYLFEDMPVNELKHRLKLITNNK